MISPGLQSFHAHTQQAKTHLEESLSGLRTDRASPTLVEQISVACYGSSSPLVQVAAIHAPAPQVLVIQPWDPSIIKDVEKALQQSSLGITPVVDGKSIRLPFPPMNQERRQELVKTVKEKGEQARVRIRTAREDAINKMRLAERSGEVSEDATKQAEKELQQIVNQSHQEIETILEKKITELETL